MSVAPRPSIFDRLRPHLDAADLIQRLGLEEVRVAGAESYCRPLCHESSSGESLQINLHTGRWNCKACQPNGFYGDLFGLVEYALTGGGAPSHGEGMPESRRAALEWLCEEHGIPFDENRTASDPGLAVVHTFAMAAHRHLLESPDVLAWILDKWGFDESTVEAYGLGYMPNPLLPRIVSEASNPGSKGAFRSSGLGWYTPEGSWKTRFAGRITFPYLEHGLAVYLIGRATERTPELEPGRAAPKYHKLSVHSDTRPYVSERVTNDHLYNEPVMSTGVASVVVAEGVADAVALSALGVPVVSPVTISFNATDLERFTRKAREHNLARVEILFDNELSGSGNWAARRAGRQLVEHGIAAIILTLPLGDEQKAARDEVVQALGADLFDELERSDPRRRKELILEALPDEGRRAWVLEHVQRSKIDAAEWAAAAGPGAPGQFDAIRKAGRDVIELEIEELLKTFDTEAEVHDRIAHFREVIELAAWIEDRLQREVYAGWIAKAAGRKGASKAEIARRIAAVRKEKVKPARKEQGEAEKVARAHSQVDLILPTPELSHSTAAPPAPPKQELKPGQKAPPPSPGELKKKTSGFERFANTRDAVSRAVEAKVDTETLGIYIAQVISKSMGFTAFRTPNDLYLVRGSERIRVGVDRYSSEFRDLIAFATGLIIRRPTHAIYVDFAVFYLGNDARKASEVSWSYVNPERQVFFPTGDSQGRIVRIEPNAVGLVKMSDVRVPAVGGEEFNPIDYVEGDGVARALELFNWTSLSHHGRLVLVHWIACLPILRRVGTIPIVRIEGGSSSGKTRTVDAVSFLVNGRKGSSVPTAAALISRLSTEMLTVDDNRETGDVTPSFLGTLLQATHLGAREKRKGNSDTGTVIERVCGALLMNGVEPIHNGKSELASRMLVLRCSPRFRAEDSPRNEDPLQAALLEIRDAFWSESFRRCAVALELDKIHGEEIAAQIEEIFGATKIGRLSSYLRLMVLSWIAGRPEEDRPRHLASLPPVWGSAFEELAAHAMQSLVPEELSVVALRYVFAHGREVAERPFTNAGHRVAFEGKFTVDDDTGAAGLEWVRSSRLARLARAAGKAFGGPREITTELRSGQLAARILDGIAFIEEAGFTIEVEETGRGRQRFRILQRADTVTAAPQAAAPHGGDTWVSP